MKPQRAEGEQDFPQWYKKKIHHGVLYLIGCLSYIQTLKIPSMHEFMLLVRGKDPHSGSPEELQQRMNAYIQWMQKMIAEGRYKGGQPLEEGEGRLLRDKNQV